MKKIGFVDYYLDEWHANNYPQFISEITKDMTVAYAYGAIDAPKGITNAAWCEKNGVKQAATIEEVVENCDYIIVLSPDNPEQHETLSKLPLMSGKRVYIDKTFATTRAEAVRMFELADKYNTPMYSSSALRFSKEFAEVNKENITFINSRGPGTFEIYGIHQFEPIVSLMGPDIKRVMHIGNGISPAFQIEFSNGRKAITSHFGWECPFSIAINYASGNAKVINDCTDYFPRFIQNLVAFLETGDVKAPAGETIAIASLIESGYKAVANPGIWVNLPK